METLLFFGFRSSLYEAPHSLGKLIEWKQFKLTVKADNCFTPHSLGKLIEWKRAGSGGCLKSEAGMNSPLAGETN